MEQRKLAGVWAVGAGVAPLIGLSLPWLVRPGSDADPLAVDTVDGGSSWSPSVSPYETWEWICELYGGRERSPGRREAETHSPRIHPECAPAGWLSLLVPAASC